MPNVNPPCLRVPSSRLPPACGRMSARGGKKKATKMSRSARAGVIFPVGRMMRYLRTSTHKYRIGMGAPVYMAAVIEYLAGETTVGTRLYKCTYCSLFIKRQD